MLEHCDIQRSGKIFVKFHTNDRFDFERRVRARANGYHRENVGLKEAEAARKREELATIRKEKHEAWRLDQRRRKRWGWLRIIGIKI